MKKEKVTENKSRERAQARISRGEENQTSVTEIQGKRSTRSVKYKGIRDGGCGSSSRRHEKSVCFHEFVYK